MKVVLVAINAKYIHSNLAVYDLRAYAKGYLERLGWEEEVEIQIAEYTINQRREEILADLFRRNPEVIGISCYIWNISIVKEMLEDIWKVLPWAKIWLGGPEVSFAGKELLEKYPRLSGVMAGEGEYLFGELLASYIKGEELTGVLKHKNQVKMDEIPFVYEEMKGFEHRIIYYESSRGCPFSCSYCMSSIEKCLRVRSLSLVFSEIQFFLNQKVKQVKFIDRTFNCQRERSRSIWRYILEHDNQITNFHFEIGADLLEEEDFQIISQMRPGLIQLEIGIQSTNSDTLREISRFASFKKIQEGVNRIRGFQNTHLHLDLIAGLPLEGYDSFANSFNEVYKLKPTALQLGFLKVLKGTPLEIKKENYQLAFTKEPPYEVLSTKWISYGELLRLKDIEEMVEVFYNSNQFVFSCKKLEPLFVTPFALFEALAKFYREKGYFQRAHKRESRYLHLLEFWRRNQKEGEEDASFEEGLRLDFYGRENSKHRPVFFQESACGKDKVTAFYKQEAKERRYLGEEYANWDSKQLERQTHLEWIASQNQYILFDYLHRNPLTGNAKNIEIKEI